MAESKTGHAVARLALGVIGFFYNPWVFAKSWNWTVAPLGMPEIGMWQAAALVLLLSWPVIASMIHLSKLDQDETNIEKTTKSVLVSLFMPTILLGLSYLYLYLGSM